MLLYIHGFNSSPQSFKATCYKQWLSEYYPRLTVAVPYLKPYPKESIEQLQAIIEPALTQNEKVGLVGSSLGGYYATWLAEHYNLRAVLINPSIRPFELLARYIGENKNFYNDDHYLFEQKHVDELLTFHVPTLSRPENFLLLVQTSDETLDFKEATAKYIGSENIIEYGGDHGFQNFDRYFLYTLKFLQLV